VSEEQGGRGGPPNQFMFEALKTPKIDAFCQGRGQDQAAANEDLSDRMWALFALNRGDRKLWRMMRRARDSTLSRTRTADVSAVVVAAS
jgi:hypothetical protein